MANICEYQMKVIGSNDSFRAFTDILKASVSRDNAKEVLGGIISADVSEIIDGAIFIAGTCKWSILTSMIEGPSSYYNDYKEKPEEWSTPLTNLVKLAKELNLTIEAFSNELGLGFTEYYLITPDGVKEDICNDIIFDTNKGQVSYGAFTI